MKQEIIDFMRSRLGNGSFALSDFAIDLRSLADYDEPFIWCSRENATNLCQVGYKHIKEVIYKPINELSRMAWFNDFYVFAVGILYFNNNESIIYYYDGNDIRRITYDEIKPIYDKHLLDLYHDVIADFAGEYKMRKKPLPIKVKCTISFLKECLKKADELNESSLRDCLYRLRRWTRFYKNQYIEIYADFAQYSLYFEEKHGDEGKVLLRGGIIFYNGKWNMHT